MRVCRWCRPSRSSSAVAGGFLCIPAVGAPVAAVVLLCILAAAASPTAAATSMEVRARLLCSAELLVVRADARKHDGLDSGAPLARGLRNRIASTLATLPITCRRYAAAVSMPFDDTQRFVARIRQLRMLFDTGERNRFAEELDALVVQAPFVTKSFLRDRDGDEDEREAGIVYRQLCHGCHVATAPDAENPAEPLDRMARLLPRDEFLARMLLGVRGTPEIGLANPLTPFEIGAMMRFLLSGNSRQHSERRSRGAIRTRFRPLRHPLRTMSSTWSGPAGIAALSPTE